MKDMLKINHWLLESSLYASCLPEVCPFHNTSTRTIPILAKGRWRMHYQVMLATFAKKHVRLDHKLSFLHPLIVVQKLVKIGVLSDLCCIEGQIQASQLLNVTFKKPLRVILSDLLPRHPRSRGRLSVIADSWAPFPGSWWELAEESRKWRLCWTSI